MDIRQVLHGAATLCTYAGDTPAGDDTLAAQAWDIIRETKRASTSLLQRRLAIGFNRASRLLEILEARGFIGPEIDHNPRTILVSVDTIFNPEGA